MFAQLAWNHVENNKLRKINFNFEKKTFTHTHTKHWREKNVRKSEQKKKITIFSKTFGIDPIQCDFFGEVKVRKRTKNRKS